MRFSVPVNWSTVSQSLVSGAWKANNLGLLSPNGAITALILNHNAADQHSVKGAIASLQRRPQAGSTCGARRRKPRPAVWGKLDQGVLHPTFQGCLTAVVALRSGRIRTNIWSVRRLPAKLAEPAKGGLLNVGFDKRNHGVLNTLGPSPITLSIRFFSFCKSSSGVDQTM